MFVSLEGPTTIEKGSTVIVGGDLGVDGGQFLLDKTSSATVSGNFFNDTGAFGSAGTNIDGALLVKGTLFNSEPPNAPGAIIEIGGSTNVHTVQNDGLMTVNGTLSVNGGGFSNNVDGSLTISGVTNVKGGFNSSGGSVILNPAATLTADSYSLSNGDTIVKSGGTVSATTLYSQSSGTTDVSGTLSTASFINQGGGFTVIESGGTVSATGSYSQGDGFTVVSGTLSTASFINQGGGFTLIASGGTVSATTLYSQSSGTTDVSGTLSTASYKQSGGDTIIESGGTVSATTFKVTGGTVTVNGTLDPTAVEIGSGATLQGMGKIVGNVSMGGTMIPGDPALQIPGNMTIFGNYEQIGNGTLVEMISPSSYAFLNVNGDVALDSDSFLQISLVNGFFNPLGQTFSIMDYNSLVGQFANGSSFLDDGYLWDISYGKHEIDVTAVPTPEPSSRLLLLVGCAALALCAQRKMAKTHHLA